MNSDRRHSGEALARVVPRVVVPRRRRRRRRRGSPLTPQQPYRRFIGTETAPGDQKGPGDTRSHPVVQTDNSVLAQFLLPQHGHGVHNLLGTTTTTRHHGLTLYAGPDTIEWKTHRPTRHAGNAARNGKREWPDGAKMLPAVVSLS
jgi:hypothetical protein